MGKLSGKNITIIASHEFEDVELLYPILRLSEEGADITVVPVKSGFHSRPYVNDKPVTGRFGHPIPIPVMGEGNRYEVKELEEISADEIDCLLIPGGFSPDHLRVHEPTVELVKECDQKNKFIAPICHGPWLLVESGLAEGTEVTGYTAVKNDLINAGAHFVDKPVVKDGNIITGRVPDDLPEFCRMIINSV